MTCEFREDVVRDVCAAILEECAQEGVEDRRLVARLFVKDAEMVNKFSWLERREIVARVARGR